MLSVSYCAEWSVGLGPGLTLQEGKELAAKAKADAAVKNEAIKAQLARQLADRAQHEQQEKQEEMEYAQLEQVIGAAWHVAGY